MVNSQDSNGIGGRFALLQPDEVYDPKERASAASSKRRRRKSAKASLSDNSTSIDGLILNGRPTLRTVSEVDVLRSNSAEVSSSLDAAATVVLGSARLDRHTDAEIPQHNAKRPHASLSFQEPNRGSAESKYNKVTGFTY